MAQVRVFGRFSLAVAGVPVEFPTAKTKELAALLVLHRDEWVSREQLRSALWPDAPEERASANLRQTLYRLKGALGPCGAADLLEARRSVARMTSAPGGLVVDGIDFRLQAQAASLSETFDLAAATAAIALYGGPLLEELGSEWVLVERRRMEALYASLLRRAVESLASAGLYEPAIPHVNRWIELDPLNEEAHRTAMRLYVAAGNPGGAVQQFEACRRQLDDGLGILPSQETRELAESIVAVRLAPRARSTRRERLSRPLYRNIADDPLYKAGLLVALGSRHADVGKTEHALEALDSAKSIYEEHGDAEGLARVALATAVAHIGTTTGPRPDLAREPIEVALAHYGSSDGSPVYCRTLYVGANVAGLCGDGDRQYELALEGLRVARQLDNKDFEARFETMMAIKCMTEHRFSEALECLDRVRALLPHMVDPGDVAMFLVYYACVPLLAGEMNVSAERHEELIALMETLEPGMQRYAAEIPARLLLMGVYYFQGRPGKVRQAKPPTELERFIPEHALHVSRLFLRPADPVAAACAASDIIRANLPVIIDEQKELFIRQISEILSENGLHREALEWADTGIEHGSRAGLPGFAAAFHATRARELAYAGETVGARASLGVVERDRDPADRWSALLALWAQGMVEGAEGDADAARRTLADAAALCRALGLGLYLPRIEADAEACG